MPPCCKRISGSAYPNSSGQTTGTCPFGKGPLFTTISSHSLSFGDLSEVPSLIEAAQRERTSIEQRLTPAWRDFIRQHLPMAHDREFQRHLGPLFE